MQRYNSSAFTRALSLLGLFLVAMFVTSAQATPITFSDDFNRPDGVVGNGWLNTTGNIAGDLLIHSGALSTPHGGGSAGIYRPIDVSAPVTVSGTLTQGNGYGGLLEHYDASLLVGGSGDAFSGYGLHFYRSDQNYANSTVRLMYNGSDIATLPSSFQFGSSITPTFTVNPNGSIAGSVTGSGSTFNFNFGPQVITLPGSNFGIAMGFPDGRSSLITNETVDNLALSYGSAAAPPRASFDEVIQDAVHVFTPTNAPPNDWASFRDGYGLLGKYPPDMTNQPPAYTIPYKNFFATGIGATFIPKHGLTLRQAADLGGFDHFNWAQIYSPSPSRAGSTLDPPITGCYDAITEQTGHPCPNRDTLPWYLDEQYTIDGVQVYDAYHRRVTYDPTLQTRLEAWTADPSTLLFSDDPSVPEYFTTCLAGIRSDGTGSLLSPSDCFQWDTSAGTPALSLEQLEGLGVGGLVPHFDGFLDPNDPRDLQRFTNLQSTVERVTEPSETSLFILTLAILGAMRVAHTHSIRISF